MVDSVLPIEAEKSPPASVCAPMAPRGRLLLTAFLFAAFMMFGAECLRVFVGSNFHVVAACKCFRSAQPSAEFLEGMKQTHGIRSVINLRDENVNEEWYRLEKQAAQSLGIHLIDAGLSSLEPPPVEDFHRFVRGIDACEEPTLIHCANGNDRTGFASAVYLLMRTDTPIAEARRHLSLRYGHFSWTKAACLNEMLDGYETWLKQNSQQHSAAHFREWAFHVFK